MNFTGVLGVAMAMICALPAWSQPTNSRRPNIVIILADDLGYGDIGGIYGGMAPTPNLDRMAQEGMAFTDFHSNGPSCSPTRAALITGRYPQRVGIEKPLPTDWDDEGIGRNRDEVTIGEYLGKAGYATALYGKWHLGKHPSANPVLHGFDDFRGMTCGCGDYFTKTDRNGVRDWWHNDKRVFQEGYATDVITDNAVEFIQNNKSRAFFLYVAYNAIHFPWQTAEDYDLETRQEGGDYTGSEPGVNSKLGPHSPKEVRDVVHQMVARLDEGVGRILKALKQAGIDEQTLVFFTSDNGGYLHYNNGVWSEVSSNGPFRGQKGQLYEGGHRVPAIARWPGTIKAGTVTSATTMTFDLLPTVLDLLGVPLPAGNSARELDGASILSLLTENSPPAARVLYWRTPGQKAVREGNWKLVATRTGDAPELFDLGSDPSETSNLAERYPDKVQALMAKLNAWERKVDSGL